MKTTYSSKHKRYFLKHKLRCQKNVAAYYQRRRIFIAELKNRPCMDCQGWFHPVQMDFDHRPNEIKKFGISTRYCATLKRILKEMKKCDIVCANCHRLRTLRRNQYAPNCYRSFDRINDFN